MAIHLRQRPDSATAGRPRIKPIPLHQPWPKPPAYLGQFHFYSEWQAHRTAQTVGLIADPPRPRRRWGLILAIAALFVLALGAWGATVLGLIDSATLARLAKFVQL